MLPTYNDEDIIQEVIEHLISQEIPLVVLDNGSTDNTYKICEKFVGDGILELKQFRTQTYQWDLILRMLYDIALTHAPDWVIRSDSDEILESGIKNLTLKKAIEQIDTQGYNLIQFDGFEFFMTNEDDSEKSVRKKMKYYSWQGDFFYRAWKYNPGIRIGDKMGHLPIFPDGLKYNISPQKFVLRHYPFRSKKQAETKMKNRIRGREKSTSKLALDQHEKNILNLDYSKKFDHNLITKYNEDGKWEYKIKLCPYTHPNPPRKEDIFTKDGELKEKPLSNMEYRLLLLKERNRFFARNIRRFKRLLKMETD